MFKSKGKMNESKQKDKLYLKNYFAKLNKFPPKLRVIFIALGFIIIATVTFIVLDRNTNDEPKTNEPVITEEQVSDGLERASLTEQEGDYTSSIESYLSVLDALSGEDKADTEFRIGELYAYGGNYEEALKYYTLAEESYRELGNESREIDTRQQKEVVESQAFAERYSSEQEGP